MNRNALLQGLNELKAEYSQRGKELYEQHIRAQVETEANLGKFVSIDIETGDYEIADNPVSATKRLIERHPDKDTYTTRIGV